MAWLIFLVGFAASLLACRELLNRQMSRAHLRLFESLQRTWGGVIGPESESLVGVTSEGVGVSMWLERVGRKESYLSWRVEAAASSYERASLDVAHSASALGALRPMEYKLVVALEQRAIFRLGEMTLTLPLVELLRVLVGEQAAQGILHPVRREEMHLGAISLRDGALKTRWFRAERPIGASTTHAVIESAYPGFVAFAQALERVCASPVEHILESCVASLTERDSARTREEVYRAVLVHGRGAPAERVRKEVLFELAGREAMSLLSAEELIEAHGSMSDERLRELCVAASRPMVSARGGARHIAELLRTLWGVAWPRYEGLMSHGEDEAALARFFMSQAVAVGRRDAPEVMRRIAADWSAFAPEVQLDILRAATGFPHLVPLSMLEGLDLRGDEGERSQVLVDILMMQLVGGTLGELPESMSAALVRQFVATPHEAVRDLCKRALLEHGTVATVRQLRGHAEAHGHVRRLLTFIAEGVGFSAASGGLMLASDERASGGLTLSQHESGGLSVVAPSPDD